VVPKDCYLLRCDIQLSGSHEPTFLENLQPPSSGYLSTPKMEAVGTHLPDNRVTCRSRQLSLWLHEACTTENPSRMLITDGVRAPPIMGHSSGPALSPHGDGHYAVK